MNDGSKSCADIHTHTYSLTAIYAPLSLIVLCALAVGPNFQMLHRCNHSYFCLIKHNRTLSSHSSVSYYITLLLLVFLFAFYSLFTNFI